MGACEGYCLLNVADAFGLDEISRGTSNFEGGQRRQRNVFEKQHE